VPYLVHSSGRRSGRWGEVSDLDLMIGLRAEQDGAFDELIRRKAGPLIQVVARIVGDREEARDIVQVVFLRVWEHRHRFRDRWSPNTWLYRIGVNLAIDHVRSQKIRERSARPLKTFLWSIQGGRLRSLAELERNEIGRIFDRLAAGLTERQRIVFLLAAVEGLSAREVGAILGCRASTVRNHLFAARRKLRRDLRRWYPEYAPRPTGGRPAR
jgi:RNA polymerase sigma-70 factor (ECF subfamily)